MDTPVVYGYCDNDIFEVAFVANMFILPYAACTFSRYYKIHCGKLRSSNTRTLRKARLETSR